MSTPTSVPTIPEGHRLVGATANDRPVPIHDDGDGELFVYRRSLGPWLFVAAIVRASSWEKAYDICLDEFADEAPPIEDIMKECECKTAEELDGNEAFDDGYGFRPSGPNVRDVQCHGIYEKDYHEKLDGITLELIETYSITITTKEW